MKDNYFRFGHGDIVIDDVTYHTQRFDLGLWARVGIDNHGKTVLYGFGLVEGENNESMHFIHSNFL